MYSRSGKLGRRSPTAKKACSELRSSSTKSSRWLIVGSCVIEESGCSRLVLKRRWPAVVLQRFMTPNRELSFLSRRLLERYRN
eukprot:998504-Rhodomonas_salina.2